MQPTPHQEYICRRDRFAAEEERLGRIDSRIALLRGLLFLIGLFLLGLYYVNGSPAVAWVLIPVFLFWIAVIVHGAVLRQKARVELGIRFYRRNLDRLAGRWAGQGTAGLRYRDSAHAYADDLDLFGEGSVFELLCRCATRLGEDRLAQWLKNLAPRDVVLQRQAAVDELRSRYDLREVVGLSVDPELQDANQNLLRAWSGVTAQPVSGKVKLLAAVLGAVFWICFAVWMLDLVKVSVLLIAYVLCLLLAFRYRRRLLETAQAIDRADGGLQPLLTMLRLIERQKFQSPLLHSLTERLTVESKSASASIEQLHNLSHALDAVMRNQFLAPLAVTFGLHVILFDQAERWRNRFGPHVPGWLDAVGEFEALLSLSGHAAEHPGDPWAEITEHGPLFSAKSLGHPLLPQDRCVRNDVQLGDGLQLLVVSGSNMAGKSTLLRSVGVNAVLALTGSPVRAGGLKISALSLGSALRSSDSLRDGKSLFFAALERLRQVATLADSNPPVLFLLDELLAGTNSHDRRIGAEAVLRRLLNAGAFGIVTTHDLALTEIAEELAPKAANVHFRDVLVGGTLQFDHTLRPGVVDRGNALALMRGLGLISDGEERVEIPRRTSLRETDPSSPPLR